MSCYYNIRGKWLLQKSHLCCRMAVRERNKGGKSLESILVVQYKCAGNKGSGCITALKLLK